MPRNRQLKQYVSATIKRVHDNSLESALRLQERGHYKEATEGLKKIRLSRPQDYVVNINLGICLLKSGEVAEAASILHLLHESHPTDDKLLDLCAKGYFHLQQFELAIKFWRLLAKSKPDNFEIWCNLALAASSCKKNIDAVAYAFKALEQRPTSPVAYNNLGSALLPLLREEEALQCFKISLELDPKNTDALSNIAILYQRNGHHQEALECLNRCSEIGLNGHMQDADLLYKMSFSYLSLGRLVDGWEAYEFGFADLSYSGRNPKRKFTTRQWSGECLEGKRILVWREQGLGDEIFFYSMLIDLESKGAQVIVECEGRLEKILKRSFPAFEIRTQRFNPLTGRVDSEDYDFHCPVGSLARFFRRSKDDFLSGRRGYLKPDFELVEKFRKRLSASSGLKIGISWRTGISFANRAINATSLDDWFPELLFEGVTFVNLFYGDGEGELCRVEERFGIKVWRWDDVDLRNDQDSLAAIISNLDLVISSDSAPAMLAGALGAPLYMYGNPGFCNFGTDQFLWFPHAKFFSPQRKELASVIPTIAQALKRDYSLVRAG